jgi:hypothetical protein
MPRWEPAPVHQLLMLVAQLPVSFRALPSHGGCQSRGLHHPGGLDAAAAAATAWPCLGSSLHRPGCRLAAAARPCGRHGTPRQPPLLQAPLPGQEALPGVWVRGSCYDHAHQALPPPGIRANEGPALGHSGLRVFAHRHANHAWGREGGRQQGREVVGGDARRGEGVAAPSLDAPAARSLGSSPPTVTSSSHPTAHPPSAPAAGSRPPAPDPQLLTPPAARLPRHGRPRRCGRALLQGQGGPRCGRRHRLH